MLLPLPLLAPWIDATEWGELKINTDPGVEKEGKEIEGSEGEMGGTPKATKGHLNSLF